MAQVDDIREALAEVLSDHGVEESTIPGLVKDLMDRLEVEFFADLDFDECDDDDCDCDSGCYDPEADADDEN